MLYDRYIIKQVFKSLLILMFLLVTIIWLVQSSRLFEIVLVNTGSGALLFSIMIMLLPPLLAVMLPITMLIALLIILNRLHSDSEIIAFFNSGRSAIRLSRPCFIIGFIVCLSVLIFNIFLSPQASRYVRFQLFSLQGESLVGLLKAGQFYAPQKGITIYVNNVRNGGQLQGLFLHDNRNPKQVMTYSSRDATIITQNKNQKLVMLDGLIQQWDPEGNINSLKFAKFSYDLEGLLKPEKSLGYKPGELMITKLLNPSPELPDATKRRYIARGHQQISSSLYPIGFAAIISFLLLRPLSQRGKERVIMIAISAATCILLRLTGMGVQALAVDIGGFYLALTYLIPLLPLTVWLSNVTWRPRT